MYSVAIIGAGKIGAMFDEPESKEILTHAHGFSESPYFQLKGFYDVEEQRAKEAAEIWGTSQFQTLEEALEGADVVCCCVPDNYHHAVLKAVSRFPVKLVITEKPLTSTLAEAEEIEKLYGSIPCMVNYSRRFLREYQKLKEEIPCYGQFLKGTGYYGKGILHNGSHMIDLLQFLLGKIEGYGHPEHGIHDFWEEDPSCDVGLLIAGGMFQMNAIDCSVATIFELDLFFEKARVRVLDGGMEIERYAIEESKTFSGYYNYVLENRENVDYSNAIKGLVENAAKFLNGEEPLKCPLEDGKNVLECCLEIRGDLG